MYIPNKKHTLSKNQVEKFIQSCPETVNPKEFMSLMCLMLDLYDFDKTIIVSMMKTMAQEIDKYQGEEFKFTEKLSVH